MTLDTAARGRRVVLPDELRRPIAAVAALAGVVLIVMALAYAGGDSSSPLDGWARSLVAGLPQSDALLLIDSAAGHVGAAVLVGLLTVACLAFDRRRLAVVAIVGPALTGGVVTVLKPIVGRTIHGGHLAFPSGHTAVATALALVLMLLVVDLLLVRAQHAALLIAAGTVIGGTTMAIAQIVLGAHYPTDTIGGFCTAVVVAAVTAWSIDAAADMRRRKRR